MGILDIIFLVIYSIKKKCIKQLEWYKKKSMFLENEIFFFIVHNFCLDECVVSICPGQDESFYPLNFCLESMWCLYL